MPVIYIDVNSDSYQASYFFEALVYLCWSAGEVQTEPIVLIPKGRDFISYSNEKKIRQRSVDRLREAAGHAADLVPGASAPVRSLLNTDAGKARSEPAPEVPSTFFDFLRWLAAMGAVLVCIDNYQFLGWRQRLMFERTIQTLQSNLRLVIVWRTDGGGEQLPEAPGFFQENWHEIGLSNVGESEIEGLVANQFPWLSTSEQLRLAADCRLKTGGNLKEVDYFFRTLRASYNQQPEKRAEYSEIAPEHLTKTLDRLPLEERLVLALAAFFPAGLKVPHLEKIAQNQMNLVSSSIGDTVRGLAGIGYVILNSKNGDLVRPAHEKVVTSMREILSDVEIVELRAAAIQTFDGLIERRATVRKEVAYLLHCLVGLLTLKEALSHLDKVSMLFDLEYSRGNHSYLLGVLNSMPDLPLYLPHSSLGLVLDVYQKTSEFYKGLALIEKLRRSDARPNESILEINAAKYLNQLYRYEEAAALLDKVPRSTETLMYKLNILQCQCRDREAVALLQSLQEGEYFEDDHYYIILRNSIHYYLYEDALNRLTRALSHFGNRRLVFEQATVQNNIGVVEAWAGRLDSAEGYLSAAAAVFRGLGSSEIYQPLINLSVTAILRGNLERGEELAEEARMWVAPSLALDLLAIDNNQLVSRFLRGSIGRAKATAEFEDFLLDAARVNDPRLTDVLELNYRTLTQDQSNYEPRSNMRTENAGYEVPIAVGREDDSFELWLILSPHWRY